jgi:hypothetical protein
MSRLQWSDLPFGLLGIGRIILKDGPKNQRCMMKSVLFI